MFTRSFDIVTIEHLLRDVAMFTRRWQSIHALEALARSDLLKEDNGEFDASVQSYDAPSTDVAIELLLRLEICLALPFEEVLGTTVQRVTF